MALGGTIALDNSLGALEIGVTLAALLFGVLCVQAWSYYNEYRRDPWHIKLLVGIIFMGNLLHQIFLSYSLYTLTITHYGEIEWVLSIPWSFLALVGTSGCIAFVAQLFYVHRIYHLSQGMYSLTGFLGATSLAEFVVNMYAVWKAKTITVYTDQYKLKPYLLTYNALGAFLDCVLAGTMIYLLSKNRTKTMFRRTNTMITRLMMYCLNTGVFTSMAAVLTIITLAIWDKTMIDHPFYFALPRLYGASLLGILNARNDIRNGRNYGTSGMYSANEISIAWAQTHDMYSEDVSSRSTKPTVEPESPCVEECVAMKDIKTELQPPSPS